MTITKKLTGWLDYDEGQLSGLSLNEKIQHFETFQMVLIGPLDRLINEEELLATEGTNAVLIAGQAICHGIEALGRFQNGQRENNGKECFKAFAQDYMHEDFRLKKFGGKSYPDRLWHDFQCAVVHGFSGAAEASRDSSRTRSPISPRMAASSGCTHTSYMPTSDGHLRVTLNNSGPESFARPDREL